MDKLRPHSFATRLVVAFVGAAVALMLFIGLVSSLFTFGLYARTSNEVIASTSRTLERRIAEGTVLGPRLVADLARPRIHVAVYGDDGRLITESGPPREPAGFVGAVASLMGLHRARVQAPGGFAIISADLNQLDETLQAYWMWMLPLGMLAVVAAWGGGVLITRTAVRPLKQISAAMRRFAEGDFRPEPVRAVGDDELGELAHSYNGALHQVQSALSQRDRTEAEIRQFIADAGHELRTPLTVIMGYLDVLEDGAGEAGPIRDRVLATMRQESRRMRALIDKLIYLARLERGEPDTKQIVDVVKVVARVVDTTALGTIAVSGVRNARIVADETDIAEAVRNLIDNALKYAPGSDIVVSIAAQGDDVVIVVSDRGPGMSAQDQAHAFDRFYRGHAAVDVEGSGIGLAIVKRAIERAGGTVSLASREGSGTEFTIRLPAAETRPSLSRSRSS